LDGEIGKGGKPVSEPVTESDVSECLNTPEMEVKWKGWDILDLGGCDRVHPIRLVRDVVRPYHTSCRLEMGGEDYRYAMTRGGGIEFFTGKKDEHVENLDIIQSLNYFLKNEGLFFSRAEQRKAG